MKKSMRKILSGFLALAICVATLTQGMGIISAQGENGPAITGLTVQGPWNYDKQGLHLAWADDTQVVSTEKGDYGVGEYKFKLYSGQLADGDVMALYLMNKSADSPVGNGISMRWDKDGYGVYDSKGNQAFSWTELHQTLGDAWQPNTWYEFYLFMTGSPDGRIAMIVNVLDYNAAADEFTVREALNGGGMYWSATNEGDAVYKWPEIDPDMPQTSGYIHFALENAPDGSCNDMKIDDLWMDTYVGGSDFSIEAPVPATGAEFTVVSDTLAVGDEGTLSAKAVTADPNVTPTNPYLELSVSPAGILETTIDHSSMTYRALAAGTVTVTAAIDGVVMGTKTLIVGAPTEDGLRIVNSGDSDILSLNDTGKLEMKDGSDVLNASWSAEGDSVTIDAATGEYQAVKAGTSKITATADTGEKLEVLLTVNGEKVTEGIRETSGTWSDDPDKLYVTDYGTAQEAIISTTANTYSLGEYKFNLYSGSFSSVADDYAGAVYFQNLSGNTPAGNGNSLRFGKAGIAFFDKDGNLVENMTEKHETLRNVWKENTWYGITIYVLDTKQVAIHVSVLSYDEGSDTFTVTEEPNGPNHYWAATHWDVMTPGMEQAAGFFHIVLKAEYDAKFYNFAITGYGTPSYPTVIPLEIGINDDNVKWDGDNAVLDLASDAAGSFQVMMNNPDVATSPAIVIKRIEAGAGISVTHDGTGFHYVNSGTGEAAIVLGVDVDIAPDGTVSGGREVTIRLIQKKPVTKITISGVPAEAVQRGTTGQLTAAVEPGDATSKIHWSATGNSVTVDQGGRFTAVSAGVSTVTASADGVSASVTITVASTAGIPGMTMTSGLWANSPTGLYVVEGDENADKAILSTMSDEYSIENYVFNLYTGSFDDHDFEGRLYYMNTSPDDPEGNGCYLKWDRNGLYVCDSKGNVVVDWTEENVTIKQVWAANTWYSIKFCLLRESNDENSYRMALIISVLDYDVRTDTFQEVNKLNNGNPYWAGYPDMITWTDVDPDMPQQNGYVHLVLNAVEENGKKLYYDCRIENLELPIDPSNSFKQTYVRSELLINGKAPEWSSDRKTATVYLSPNQAGDLVFTVGNLQQATSPYILIQNTASNGVTVTKKDESTVTYQADANGTGSISLLTEYSYNQDGDIYGGEPITVNLEVRILATGVEIADHPDTVAFGDMGKLTAVVEPADHTTTPVWSIVEGEGISIDKNGNYVAVCPGTTKIKVEIDGFTAETEITVTERTKVADITITGVPETELTTGDTGKVTVAVTPADAYDNVPRITIVRGTSVDFNCETGEYRAVKKGETVIRVYADGIGKEFSLKVK